MEIFENCRVCLREINHEPIKMTRLILRFLEKSLLLTNVAKPSPIGDPKQNLCAPCFNRISEFQDFLEQCKDSDEFWREQFEDIKKTFRNQVNFEEAVLTTFQEDSSSLEADTTVSTTEANTEKSKEKPEEITLQSQEVVYGHNLQVCEDENDSAHIDLANVDLTSWQEEANDNSCETQTNLNDGDDNVRNSDEEFIEYEYRVDENDEVEIEEISSFDDIGSSDKTSMNYRFTYEKVETVKPSENTEIHETVDENTEEDSKTTETTLFLTTSIDDNGKFKMIYKCPKCDKTFNRIYDIESHYNIHSGVKPFTCDVCGKSFRQKNILTTHQALHFGKKVDCAECGKKFARRSQLILHYRMHRDEKPFVCDVDGCQAAFRQRKQLIDHTFIHTGEKTFQCATCSKSFHTRKRLQDHIYKVHSQYRYRCELCEKAFLKPHMLKHHMTTVHNVEIDDVSHLKTLVDVIKSNKTVRK